MNRREDDASVWGLYHHLMVCRGHEWWPREALSKREHGSLRGLMRQERRQAFSGGYRGPERRASRFLGPRP